MKRNDINALVSILKKKTLHFRLPSVSQISQDYKGPFFVLISCLLSLRTKDKTTSEASFRLFRLAKNPSQMLTLTVREIEKAIYPVGFYHIKAKRIKEICKVLIEKFSSRVPDTLEALLNLKGVGRKTANLVLTEGFGKLGICVDTHVHRISNRLGLCETKTPEKTEFALRAKLPKKYWIEYNDLLVSFGQHLCRPISPLCSQCPVRKYCDQIGVTVRR